MASKKWTVLETPQFSRTVPIIVLNDFLVNNSFTKSTSFGTNSLNNTLPTVVSIILLFPLKVLFTLIIACKSALFSLYAILTSSNE